MNYRLLYKRLLAHTKPRFPFSPPQSRPSHRTPQLLCQLIQPTKYHSKYRTLNQTLDSMALNNFFFFAVFLMVFGVSNAAFIHRGLELPEGYSEGPIVWSGFEHVLNNSDLVHSANVQDLEGRTFTGTIQVRDSLREGTYSLFKCLWRVLVNTGLESSCRARVTGLLHGPSEALISRGGKCNS